MQYLIFKNLYVCTPITICSRGVSQYYIDFDETEKVIELVVKNTRTTGKYELVLETIDAKTLGFLSLFSSSLSSCGFTYGIVCPTKPPILSVDAVIEPDGCRARQRTRHRHA